MDNSHWENYSHHYIPAPNISAGFHGIELDMLEYYGMQDSLILIMEPPGVVPVFQKRFPQLKTIHTIEYEGNAGENPSRDLCVPFNTTQRYSAALSQATLEHLPRPGTAIENCLRLLIPGGILVLHTVDPSCPVHRLPVDCLRYLPDFYTEITKYLRPRAELLALVESGPHQFAVWKRLVRPNSFKS